MPEYASIELSGIPYWMPEDKFEIEIDPVHWFLLCCHTCYEIFDGIKGILAAELCGWKGIERDDCDFFTYTGICPVCIKEQKNKRIWLNL